jgi:hypothetical protein
MPALSLPLPFSQWLFQLVHSYAKMVGLYRAFFMFCLRPLQAWIAISEASRDVLNLLHLKRRMSEEVHFREACHRAYWACYLIEYELKGHMCYSTPAIHLLHESIPLPLSDHEEPGIYWMLSEIALRRIFANVSDTLGLYGRADRILLPIWNSILSVYAASRTAAN